MTLARDKLHRIGIDECALGLGEPVKVRQWRYDSNGVIYPLPLYVIYWESDRGSVDMQISGITSNVASFFQVTKAKSLQVPMPTNYFEMLGLPTNVVFLPHDWERRQKLMRQTAPQHK